MPSVAAHPSSILFVTLDSCRFDTFEAASAPTLRAVGPLHRAMAPGNFTFSSHAAMFVGFTPGVAGAGTPFVNPKLAKIFKLVGAGFQSHGGEFAVLRGHSIVDGLRRVGYRTFGSGAMGWFNPDVPTGRHLTQDFEEFLYPGRTWGLDAQLSFAEAAVAAAGSDPLFLFLNIGETHVPYFHDGADWDPARNPCVPFADDNDAAECRRRQLACVAHIDRRLAPLLDEFRGSTVVVCADHGDAWGEDGLWEHGISHEKVLEVPLLFRLGTPPPAP